MESMARASDPRRGLLRAEQAAAEAMTLGELASTAFAPLAAALDAPIVSAYTLDDEGTPSMYFMPGLETTVRTFVQHHRASDQLTQVKRRLNPRLAVTTDLVDRRSFMRSVEYNELYVKLDVEHQLVARLTTVGFGVPGCTAMVLGRAARQRRFGEREVMAVRRLMPAFEAAVRRSQRAARAELGVSALAAILERGGSSSYLLLDGAGRLLWRSPRAARSCPDPIPEPIVQAARRLAAAARASELPPAPAPFSVTVEGAGASPLVAEPFVIRAAEHGAPLVAVRLDDGRWQHAALVTLARRAGLTPGELSVLERLARGGRNHDIAAALHVSTETVRTHVSRILRKLGVRSRLEAVVLVRDVERERER